MKSHCENCIKTKSDLKSYTFYAGNKTGEAFGTSGSVTGQATSSTEFFDILREPQEFTVCESCLNEKRWINILIASVICIPWMIFSVTNAMKFGNTGGIYWGIGIPSLIIILQIFQSYQRLAKKLAKKHFRKLGFMKIWTVEEYEKLDKK
jgi:hypothetical protein